jgi:NAD(P)-dependent dehydrogenase (short-subunit alcohol dehydrogenase family)
MRLKDKIAIVVGAGSIRPGIGNGKATAILFAKEGANGKINHPSRW